MRLTGQALVTPESHVWYTDGLAVIQLDHQEGLLQASLQLAVTVVQCDMHFAGKAANQM